MSDAKLFVLHHSSELLSANDLKTGLTGEMSTLLTASEMPEIEMREGFLTLPAASALGPFSLALVLLPPVGRPFSDDEKTALEAFLDSHGTNDIRLVPISLDEVRSAHPEPLDDLKSFALSDLHDAQLINSLTTRLAEPSPT